MCHAWMLQQESATAATKRVRQGMSSLLGEITRVLTIPPDDQGTQAEGGTATGGQPIFDRARVSQTMH